MSQRIRDIVGYSAVNDRLGDRIDDFVKCHHDGFNDYKSIMDFIGALDVPTDYKVRSKACIIHEQIKARLIQRFFNEPDVTIGEWRGVFGLQFEDEFLIRVKKFLKGGSISNYPTPQHKTIMKQGVLEGFPDKPTFIISGYLPDRTLTEIVGVYLACWSADGLQWFKKIGGDGFEQGIIEFEGTPLQPTGTTRVRVRATGSNTKTGTANE